jgi:hypothetical protein
MGVLGEKRRTLARTRGIGSVFAVCSGTSSPNGLGMGSSDAQERARHFGTQGTASEQVNVEISIFSRSTTSKTNKYRVCSRKSSLSRRRA